MANEDIVQTPNEDLANRTPSDGLEIYYAAVIVLLRASFTRISETSLSDFPWLSERDLAPNPAPILPLEDIPPEGIWLPFDPYASTAGGPRPPYPIPPDVGFQLVSVVGFAEFALIALGDGDRQVGLLGPPHADDGIDLAGQPRELHPSMGQLRQRLRVRIGNDFLQHQLVHASFLDGRMLSILSFLDGQV